MSLPESLEFWIAELSQSDHTRRRLAAKLLGQRRAIEALLPLSRVLETELDPDSRSAIREAVIALEELPVAQQVEALLPALTSVAAEEDRTLALERLVRFYKRTSPEDRVRIQTAVATLTMPQAEPWRGRWQQTLERLEPPKTAPSKSDISYPSDPDVLVRLLTHADDAIRVAATAELVRLGEVAVPALEKGLNSGFVVRRYCIEALRQLGHPKAVPVLVEARRVYTSLHNEIDNALRHTVKVLTDNPQDEYFGLYSRLVRDFRDEVPELAIVALKAIVVLARRQPEHRHRSVLSLLKTQKTLRRVPVGWGFSTWGYVTLDPTLVQLSKELDGLTESFKNLPIPAESAKATRDLPRPSKPE